MVSSGSARTREVEIEVKDMQPLHVYTVRYRLENDAPTLVIEDLGTGVEYWPSLLTRKAAF